MDSIYLRKSRADLEAEARGEGETLARHKRTLLAVAAEKGMHIGHIYQEIASADTIAGRPQMQQLLRDLEAGMWERILVMDIDRLGRGDGIDQAIILKTIKYAGAVVVTPSRTYDPNNEFDEEYFEYNQQMARGEYRRIKRRMWAGREASVHEGKYQGGKVPFGYEKVKLRREKGWTLRPVPDEAEAVRTIFQLYAYGDEQGKQIGMETIARRVNAMGFTTWSGKQFHNSEISTILRNPTYIGKIRWNQRRKRSVMKDGVEIIKRPRSDEYFESDGLHDAIVTKELWDAVQARLATHKPHVRCDDSIANPFAGLIFCPHCGKTMVRTPIYDRPVQGSIRCPTPRCPTSAIDIEFVEAAVLDTLRDWTKLAQRPQPAKPKKNSDPLSAQISKVQKNIATIKKQQNRLCDLLEQGVYDTATFVSRNKELSQRLTEAEANLQSLEASRPVSHEDAIAQLRPELEALLASWPDATTEQRNTLLKSIVSKIVYHKTHRCFRNENPAEYLTLDLFPVIKSQ